MKKISAYLLVLFVFSAPVVFAGPGGGDHSHESASPISEDEALKTASGVVAEIVNEGKLDKSWEVVKPKQIIQKTFKKGPEWVVTFDNPLAENKDKQTLYVFLSLSGRYLGANFSGN
ncbi:MAG: DUF6488 family protein [Nitrospira sp.]|nr:hypothetical protein [Candidatus Manganitrophaceae bacterium]HIL35693.1 hypothetical protein [Candidatus Manganitrophaceae bacterium]